jgi:hypothetical protein
VGVEGAPNALRAVRIAKIGRHDARDQQRLGRCVQCLTDRAGRIAESFTCQRFRDQHGVGAGRPLIALDKRATPSWPHAEQVRQPTRDICGRNQLGLAARASQKDDLGQMSFDGLEQIALLLPCLECRGAHRRPECLARARVARLKFHETVGTAIRRSLKDERIGDREHDRVGGDGGRDQHDGQHRSPSARLQVSPGESDIGHRHLLRHSDPSPADSA